jgi:hypothetical protein
LSECGIQNTEERLVKELRSTAMTQTQKKKTQEPQQSQQLSAGEFTGREPMTGTQAAYLQSLANEAHDPAAYKQSLTRREASRRIDALMERLRLGALPPHTD